MSETESVSSTPSDELLQLVSDLKAERDELMRDVEGWRKRVSDLEKQIGMLNRRVEAERRDAWVASERMGVLEVEKKRVREDLERARRENNRLESALWTEETARKHAEEERDAATQATQEEQEKREAAEREAQRLQAELIQLREHTLRVEADLQAATATPKVSYSIHRFDDGDSTDVDEEYIPLGMRSLKLNSVSEEPEHDLPQSIRSDSDIGDDSDNELAHYEDDDGLDDDIFGDEDHTSSSFGSIHHTNSHLLRLDLSAVAPVPAPATSSHTRVGSMERGWSFHQTQAQAKTPKALPKVDHFFECLDALETDDSDGSSGVFATTKLFWHGAMKETEDEEEDDLPPFILPGQGTPPKQKMWKEIEAAKLESVVEEEEEEDSDAFSPRTQSPMTTPKMKKRSVDMKIPVFTPRGGVPKLQQTPPTPKQRATSHAVEAVVAPASNSSSSQEILRSPELRLPV
ncbi:hypothetical protein M422DRAFT_271882 [Sphaerobolus stellatus SS14]|uniref:Uncharacterized protein n=1 Tax=Sphaerobolus stellatus (strain SS14) TaxID=990650 RepID=A0A0C9TCU7_SPHS4|nr:hypothetical protein M422DRAFT_271882 [Sphaerobolus stellatus SS14]